MKKAYALALAALRAILAGRSPGRAAAIIDELYMLSAAGTYQFQVVAMSGDNPWYRF